MGEGVIILSGMAALTVFCSNCVKPSYPQRIASNTSLLAEISAIATSASSGLAQTERPRVHKHLPLVAAHCGFNIAVFPNLGANRSYNSRSDLRTSGVLSKFNPILGKEVRMDATPLSSLIGNACHSRIHPVCHLLTRGNRYSVNAVHIIYGGVPTCPNIKEHS